VADVFISDRESARKLANALIAVGWSVWWDRRIIAGQAFDQEIERELETAKSVVVLWSNRGRPDGRAGQFDSPSDPFKLLLLE
jgi:hypothetical protein